MASKLRLHCRVSPFDFNQEWVWFFENNDLIPEIYLKRHELSSRLDQKIDEISSWLNSKDLRPTLHAPIISSDPVIFDAVARNVARTIADSTAAIAAKLKAINIVWHPIFDKYASKKGHSRWLEENLMFFDHLIAATRHLRTTISVENVFDKKPDQLFDLIEGLASERFMLCFDVGHFNAYSSARLSKWFNLLGDKIREFHIHDNLGKTDEHLPPGEGNFQFKRLKEFLDNGNQDLILTIEPLNRQTAERANKNIRRVLELI